MKIPSNVLYVSAEYLMTVSSRTASITLSKHEIGYKPDMSRREPYEPVLDSIDFKSIDQ